MKRGGMMDFFYIVFEDKIKCVIKDGEFENFLGMGKLLLKDDVVYLLELFCMSYCMLKNVGMVEDEGVFKKEFMIIDYLIVKCYDEKECELLIRKKIEK